VTGVLKFNDEEENEMSENVRVIEIDGVKVEVDLRSAKKIEHYRVGDRVKVLEKQYSSYKMQYGVIVDFALFKDHPSIEILCVDPHGYGDNIKFLSFNSESKDVEIAPLNYLDEAFAKENVVERFDRDIAKKEAEVLEAKKKRELFLRHFGKYFEAEKEELTNGV